MASLNSDKSAPLLLTLVLLLSSLSTSLGSRKLASLYNPPPPILAYHHGALLEGTIPISILWYGNFTPAQRSIVTDFLLSLTPHRRPPAVPAAAPPVAEWWGTVDEYLRRAGRANARVSLAAQVSDDGCSMGKALARETISRLAARAGAARGGVALVLTAGDVAVEGFCVSDCGLHGSFAGAGAAYIWVGDSGAQCPGRCAWPFHQPVYGPQGPPLVAPNGDVGVDGMVVNLATLLAGAVTNPFGDGYFQGEKGAPVEVAAVCPGVYGPGAYPGYAGELRVDAGTGGSYNVEGLGGRKYLVPAIFDPSTSSCLTMA